MGKTGGMESGCGCWGMVVWVEVVCCLLTAMEGDWWWRLLEAISCRRRCWFSCSRRDPLSDIGCRVRMEVGIEVVVKDAEVAEVAGWSRKKLKTLSQRKSKKVSEEGRADK